jgi:hypothetical protein
MRLRPERAGLETAVPVRRLESRIDRMTYIAAMEALRHPKASGDVRSFGERRQNDLEFSGIPTSNGMLRDRGDNHHA